MQVLKEFVVFLVQTPKASLSALGVAIAQILKYSGMISCDQATVDTIMDSVSIILGFVGLFFASRGEWPKDKTGSGSSGPTVLKGLVLFLALALAVPSAGMCAAKTVQFSWTQEIPAGVTLGGWKIEYAAAPDGAWTLLADVPFASVNTVYTYSREIEFPDNAVTTLYFRLKAYAPSGLESAFSTVLPGGPVDLRTLPGPVWRAIIITP